MAEQFEYRFEWDPVKAERSAKDHGVTFEHAATIFLDARLLSQLDDEHGEEEERWVEKLQSGARVFASFQHGRRPDTKARTTRNRNHEERIRFF